MWYEQLKILITIDHNTVSKVSKDFNTFSSLEHHCTSSSIVTTPSLFVSISCNEK